MKTKLLAILVSGACAAFALPVQAAPGFCSDGQAEPNMSIDDVTFEGANANDCYGLYPNKNATPDQTADFANTTLATEWGAGWTWVAKDDGAATAAGSFNGFDFVLEAGGMTANTGTWTLTATDQDVTQPPNFPLYLDFLVTLKASTGVGFWFFNDREVTASNDGTWKVEFQNPGGNFPALSHMDILMRAGLPPSRIPEPMSLALLGIGLVGLGAFRRRHN